VNLLGTEKVKPTNPVGTLNITTNKLTKKDCSSIVLRLARDGKLIKSNLLEQGGNIRFAFQFRRRKAKIKKFFWTDSMRWTRYCELQRGYPYSRIGRTNEIFSHVRIIKFLGPSFYKNQVIWSENFSLGSRRTPRSSTSVVLEA